MGLFNRTPKVAPDRAGDPARKSTARGVDDWMPKVRTPESPEEAKANWNSATAQKRAAGTAAWEAKNSKPEPTKQTGSYTPTVGYSGRVGTDSEQRM